MLVCLMLLTTATFGQRRHKAGADKVSKGILSKKIVTRELVIADTGFNSALLQLTDTNGNAVDFNSIIYKAVKEFGAATLNLKREVVPVTDTILALLMQPKVINKYTVVEEWHFDQNKGEMMVRLLMIGPETDEDAKKQAKHELNDCEGADTKPLFLVNYNRLRPIFAQYATASKYNQSSVDEFFQSRKFLGRVICVENVINLPAIY